MISDKDIIENQALKNVCTELGELGSKNMFSRKTNATTDVKPIAHFLLLFTAECAGALVVDIARPFLVRFRPIVHLGGKP